MELLKVELNDEFHKKFYFKMTTSVRYFKS